MSQESLKIDIAIVGGGMVGATLACALSQSDYRVTLIEPHQPTAPKVGDPFDLRVSALSVASENILRKLGAWSIMEQHRVHAYREMFVWDAGGVGSIHFDAADMGRPHLGHIVENSVIQSALWQQLKKSTNCQIITGQKVTQLELRNACARLSLDDGAQIEAQLVVAADGVNSHMREMAGIAVSSKSYAQKGIVATIKTELSHQETAWQRFLPTGPLAFLPLSENTASIVWSLDTPEADRLMALEAKQFQQELATAFECRLGDVELLSERQSFPFKRQHAETYVLPRFALVGDAAHAIHPLAGQGVNLGLLDVATLAEELCSKRCKNPGNIKDLKRFQRRRIGDNLATLMSMSGFKNVFGSEDKMITAVRNMGLDVANKIPLVKKHFMQQAMGLSGETPALAKAVR